MKADDSENTGTFSINATNIREAMKRLCLTLLCLPLIASLGCSICKSEFDDHYPAYGGLIQRSEPTTGRVGSAFSDAGFRREVEADSDRDYPQPTDPQPDDMNQQDMNQQDMNQQDMNQQDMNQQDMNQQDMDQQDVNQQNVNQQDVNQQDVNQQAATGE